MEQWAGIIMAAGAGRRMNSRRPKPLHQVCGKELIRYPAELLQTLAVNPILVVVSPSNADPIRELLGDTVDYVIQPSPLGTGDAAAHAVAALENPIEQLIILGSDSPLLRTESVRQLTQQHLAQNNAMTILSAPDMLAPDLGRILRNDAGQITAIVEATDEERTGFHPAEVNAGLYCFHRPWLTAAIANLTTRSNGEKYLTDLVALAANQGDPIAAIPSDEPEEIFGVNDREQLAMVETIRRDQLHRQWMRSGVTIQDPASTFIDAAVTIGIDTILRPNTMLLGNTHIGADCQIGPNSVIQNSQIADRCRVTASMVEDSVMDADSDLGPFSHLRPGSRIAAGVHLGNFVEVKDSHIGPGTLAGHFCYLGDAHIGAQVNIGAGTVTCNFDGHEKHPTTIDDRAFIGCDTMLVAPVTVGPDAATGAGTVLTKDLPAALLGVGVPATIREQKPRPDRTS